MSKPVRCAALALIGACLLASASSCLIYNEDLLVDGEGGAAGAGGGNVGGGGAGPCAGVCTHLLISEIVVTPTRAEFVEIYNPLETTVSLQDVWLADFASYYTVTTGAPTVAPTDFLVEFPPGASIPPGGRVVVAIDSAANYNENYGQLPDYDLSMMGGTSTPGMSGLANSDEMVVLFEWDGGSPTVVDLDYVIWGGVTNAVDKTGLQSYANDTPAAEQRAASAPAVNLGLHRCDDDEPGETKTGGNGVLGHDETSENLPAAFKSGPATPKASPGAACD